MVSIPAPLFDLKATLDSGQVFHWLPDGEGQYLGLIGDTPVRIRQKGGCLWVTRSTEALVARYFALDHDLEAICRSFPKDPLMTRAVAFCQGIRIIRQPLWECLATFITSSMKQGAHIRQMSHAIRKRFGHSVPDWEPLTAYPSPERLAQANEAELRVCGLGYRAKNLLATAQRVASGEIDLEAIRTMDDATAIAELCRLPGVGPKIANCVLLFAYERMRAFPIDVWMERVLRNGYFPSRRKVTLHQLSAFAAHAFGPHGGYAQQYLFHHARSGGLD